jgi:hypothetical protein
MNSVILKGKLSNYEPTFTNGTVSGFKVKINPKGSGTEKIDLQCFDKTLAETVLSMCNGGEPVVVYGALYSFDSGVYIKLKHIEDYLS